MSKCASAAHKPTFTAGEGGGSRAGASDVTLTWRDISSANLIGVYQCEVCLAKSKYRFDLKLFFIDTKSGEMAPTLQ